VVTAQSDSHSGKAPTSNGFVVGSESQQEFDTPVGDNMFTAVTRGNLIATVTLGNGRVSQFPNEGLYELEGAEGTSPWIIATASDVAGDTIAQAKAYEQQTGHKLSWTNESISSSQPGGSISFDNGMIVSTANNAPRISFKNSATPQALTVQQEAQEIVAAATQKAQQYILTHPGTSANNVPFDIPNATAIDDQCGASAPEHQDACINDVLSALPGNEYLLPVSALLNPQKSAVVVPGIGVEFRGM